MRITFEYNDDEKHLVKWCLFKCSPILGSYDGEKDPIIYQHKRSITNVMDIPFKFRDIIMNKIIENDENKNESKEK